MLPKIADEFLERTRLQDCLSVAIVSMNLKIKWLKLVLFHFLIIYSESRGTAGVRPRLLRPVLVEKWKSEWASKVHTKHEEGEQVEDEVSEYQEHVTSEHRERKQHEEDEYQQELLEVRL